MTPGGEGAGIVPGMPQQRYGYDKDRVQRICRAAAAHFKARKAHDDKFRDEYFKEPGEGQDKSRSVNFFFAFVSILLSVLYSRMPKIQVEPREDAGGGEDFLQACLAAGIQVESLAEARRQYAEAAESVLTFNYEHTDSDDHNGQCIQEALVTGLGVSKLSFDSELGIDRADCLQAHEVYFDPQARFNIKQCKYVVQSCVLEIEAARKFFKEKIAALANVVQPSPYPLPGGEGEQQPVPPEFWNLDPNFNPDALNGNESLAEASPASSKETDDGKKYLRFYEITTGDGPDERYVYYATPELGVDFRTPRPFTLRTYDFPFSIIAFNRRGQCINDAFPEQAVVARLREIYQRFADFIFTLQERSIAKLAIYNKDLLNSEQVEAAKTAKTMKMIGVEGIGERDISQLFHVVNFNQGDEVLFEVRDWLKKTIDEIWGNDELMRGADIKAGTTAEEVKTRADMSGARTVRRSGIVDKFLSDGIVKRFCIARQLMDPAKVEKIAGKTAALLWQFHAADPDEMCMEYSVNIAAGSTAQRHKEEEVANLDKVIEKMDWANQSAVSTGQAPAFDVIEAVKAQLQILARNVERFEIKQGEQLPAGMPAPQMNGAQVPAGQPGNPSAGLPPAQAQQQVM